MSLVGTRPPTVDEYVDALYLLYGMTYKEDVAAVKESFSKMLEDGTYKGDLFSDL